jgi:hypothetical protein
MTRATTAPVAADERWLLRVGGASALGIGVADLAIIGLYAQVGALPTGGEAVLEYLDGKTTTWSWIIGISAATNLAFVPVALSVYAALERVRRAAMLLAVAFIGLFVVLELATSWTGLGALVVLAGDHAAATTDAGRTAPVAAAEYPAAVLQSRLTTVFAIGLLSFAILVTGLVMRRGVSDRVTAYLGVATGLAGPAAVAGWARR